MIYCSWGFKFKVNLLQPRLQSSMLYCCKWVSKFQLYCNDCAQLDVILLLLILQSSKWYLHQYACVKHMLINHVCDSWLISCASSNLKKKHSEQTQDTTLTLEKYSLTYAMSLYVCHCTCAIVVNRSWPGSLTVPLHILSWRFRFRSRPDYS